MRKFLILIPVLIFSLLYASFLSLAKEVESEEYKVAAGDSLDITVYQEDDLSGSYEVKEDGAITYPLLGSVYVKNLTRLELEQKISALLEKDYLVNPHVRVTIGLHNKPYVLLLGHVHKPGTYGFSKNKNLTLLELITEAGGFTGLAAINSTKIVRTQDNDKKVVINSRMNDIISGRRKDIELKPGDLVIVPERFF